jgi:hypothetical protein
MISFIFSTMFAFAGLCVSISFRIFPLVGRRINGDEDSGLFENGKITAVRNIFLLDQEEERQHIQEVEEKKVDNSRQYALEKPDECPVCLEKLNDEEKPWPCGHYVHRTCITRSFKAECPLCRSKLSLLPAEEREIRARANRERANHRIEFNIPFRNEDEEIPGVFMLV